jgi:heme exporter protein D
MNWNSWAEFWAMGGYGLYVWGSYLVTAVFMATEVALLFRRSSSIKHTIARLSRLRPQREGRERSIGAANETET